MIIFAFKNLKFSELSKNRKLIHLSFMKIQKSPFPEKITPQKELHKRQKRIQKPQKNDLIKTNLNTSNPIYKIKNLSGITLIALKYFIIFCLRLFYLFLSYVYCLIYSPLISSLSFLIRNALHHELYDAHQLVINRIIKTFYAIIEFKHIEVLSNNYC